MLSEFPVFLVSTVAAVVDRETLVLAAIRQGIESNRSSAQSTNCNEDLRDSQLARRDILAHRGSIAAERQWSHLARTSNCPWGQLPGLETANSRFPASTDRRLETGTRRGQRNHRPSGFRPLHDLFVSLSVRIPSQQSSLTSVFQNGIHDLWNGICLNSRSLPAET